MMDTNMLKLIQGIIRMNSEYVNTTLGKEQFLSVTTITAIGKFFSVNLKELDGEFQNLKNAKYNYNDYCELCDEGKADEYKELNKVFTYLEIQSFAELIIQKIAESLKTRIEERVLEC